MHNTLSRFVFSLRSGINIQAYIGRKIWAWRLRMLREVLGFLAGFLADFLAGPERSPISGANHVDHFQASM